MQLTACQKKSWIVSCVLEIIIAGYGIDEKQIGIMYSYPNVMPIDVMFVAESP